MQNKIDTTPIPDWTPLADLPPMPLRTLECRLADGSQTLAELHVGDWCSEWLGPTDDAARAKAIAEAQWRRYRDFAVIDPPVAVREWSFKRAIDDNTLPLDYVLPPGQTADGWRRIDDGARDGRWHVVMRIEHGGAICKPLRWYARGRWLDGDSRYQFGVWYDCSEAIPPDRITPVFYREPTRDEMREHRRKERNYAR